MAKPFKPAPGLGERLLELRGNQSREEFAELLGLHAQTIGNYERGDRKIDADVLSLIAERTGADLNWLLLGNKPSISQSSADAIPIPRYEIQASAGDGLSVLSEEVADYFTVSRDWIMRYCPPGAKLGLIEAKGDSMDPTIRDGDGLIIRLDVTRSDVGSGGIFVLNYNGNLLVKRIQVQLDGTVIVASDNINYRTETLTPEAAEQLLDVRAQVLLNIAPPRSALIPR